MLRTLTCLLLAVPITLASGCNDNCRYAFDGECDEREGTGVCAEGTDTTDCRGGGGQTCLDTCNYAGDGECDDGGPGADTSVCTLGTDCTDCGIR